LQPISVSCHGVILFEKLDFIVNYRQWRAFIPTRPGKRIRSTYYGRAERTLRE
jgi:hypothetical protein